MKTYRLKNNAFVYSPNNSGNMGQIILSVQVTPTGQTINWTQTLVNNLTGLNSLMVFNPLGSIAGAILSGNSPILSQDTQFSTQYNYLYAPTGMIFQTDYPNAGGFVRIPDSQTGLLAGTLNPAGYVGAAGPITAPKYVQMSSLEEVTAPSGPIGIGGGWQSAIPSIAGMQNATHHNPKPRTAGVGSLYGQPQGQGAFHGDNGFDYLNNILDKHSNVQLWGTIAGIVGIGAGVFLGYKYYAKNIYALMTSAIVGGIVLSTAGYKLGGYLAKPKEIANGQ